MELIPADSTLFRSSIEAIKELKTEINELKNK
jgi:hypothetical protein